MTIRTFDAVPIGTVPGATLFQLNEQRAEEGELCYTADYKKLEAELQKYKDQFPDYVKLELKLRRLAKQVIDRQCDWRTYELAREILDL